MSIWRYTAISIDASTRSDRTVGELAGDTAADVRASLRRIGLQVIDLRPLGHNQSSDSTTQRSSFIRTTRIEISTGIHHYLRRRRRTQRAEIYDSLQTLLDAGLPVLQSLQAMLGGTRSTAQRTMLHRLCEDVRAGNSLGFAMTQRPDWFSSPEIAMVEAGQHGGTLPEVLRTLSEQHEHADELNNRLINALAYPAIIFIVGIGVAVFLSVKVLPDLTQILIDADVSIPRLTQVVMSSGQFIAHWWFILIIAGFFSCLMIVLVRRLINRGTLPSLKLFRTVYPRVFRRIALANVAGQLSELLRSGIPIVEALRVTAPTVRSLALAQRLESAAMCVEQGEELPTALEDDYWFDSEICRLLEIGQTSGELDEILKRIAGRYTRDSKRLIDRLAALLEPIVILALASLVGLVVMSVVLAMMHIREIV